MVAGCGAQAGPDRLRVEPGILPQTHTHTHTCPVFPYALPGAPTRASRDYRSVYTHRPPRDSTARFRLNLNRLILENFHQLLRQATRSRAADALLTTPGTAPRTRAVRN